MSDERNPVDTALELLVFAPVGLAMAAREVLPDLIERGRTQVATQTTMARMIGQFAVSQGQARAGKALDEARDQVIATLEQFVAGAAAEEPVAEPVATHVAGNGSTPTDAVDDVPAPPSEVTADDGPRAADLAIPDYDSLAASQVVPRLSGLTAEELELVRRYEAGNRARKTILSRVNQLQTPR